MILVITGVLAGTITGLTGANGLGVITAILLLAGFAAQDVVALCLAVQCFTMSAAAVPMVLQTRPGVGLVLGLLLPSIVGARGGAALALSIPEGIIRGLIIVGLVAIGAGLLRVKPRDPDAPGGAAWRPARLAAVPALGAASGVLSGLIGGGGGIIVSNLLFAKLGFAFRPALAATLIAGVFAAFSGAVAYTQADRLVAEQVALLVVPALICAVVVARRSVSVPVVTIRRLQGGYMLISAMLLIGQALWKGGVL